MFSNNLTRQYMPVNFMSLYALERDPQEIKSLYLAQFQFHSVANLKVIKEKNSEISKTEWNWRSLTSFHDFHSVQIKPNSAVTDLFLNFLLSKNKASGYEATCFYSKLA